MYSMPSPACSKDSSTEASPPGRSGTSMARTSVTFTTTPAPSRARFAFSQSFTTRRRIPNCWVSASDIVRMSIPASPSTLQGTRSWPDRFSRKSDSWRIIMAGLPCRASDVPLVEHALRLALAARDGARRDEVHLHADPDHVVDRVGELALQRLERADGVGERLRRHLDLHLHLVEPLRPREDDLVVRQRALDLKE